MKKARFHIYEDKANEWRFHLKAKNGKIIAVSEGYKTKHGCISGIMSVFNSVREMVEEGEYPYLQSYFAKKFIVEDRKE